MEPETASRQYNNILGSQCELHLYGCPISVVQIMYKPGYLDTAVVGTRISAGPPTPSFFSLPECITILLYSRSHVKTRVRTPRTPSLHAARRVCYLKNAQPMDSLEDQIQDLLLLSQNSAAAQPRPGMVSRIFRTRLVAASKKLKSLPAASSLRRQVAQFPWAIRHGAVCFNCSEFNELRVRDRDCVEETVFAVGGRSEKVMERRLVEGGRQVNAWVVGKRPHNVQMAQSYHCCEGRSTVVHIGRVGDDKFTSALSMISFQIQTLERTWSCGTANARLKRRIYPRIPTARLMTRVWKRTTSSVIQGAVEETEVAPELSPRLVAEGGTPNEAAKFKSLPKDNYTRLRGWVGGSRAFAPTGRGILTCELVDACPKPVPCPKRSTPIEAASKLDGSMRQALRVAFPRVFSLESLEFICRKNKQTKVPRHSPVTGLNIDGAFLAVGPTHENVRRPASSKAYFVSTTPSPRARPPLLKPMNNNATPRTGPGKPKRVLRFSPSKVVLKI
ncbi:hypothetical protein C8F04DRAFT_1362829 [Mycena alexandri]|uniref:Uncharacterized protein n=1 Tax=Mycena alexandri TaxID=1745969 RepID=A0AAD6SQI7_9AGAR|nr:hypothetical protein C8F04DRAFT_1362829 [Mycena alexandri]